MKQDTISLLGDCTAGIEMALSTIDRLMPDVKDVRMRQKLQEGADRHRALRKDSVDMLHRCGGEEKLPSAMAKSMAWMKTNVKMAVNSDDTTAAYLVADGCDMGVKSLSKSRNKYASAETEAKNIAEQLIDCEEKLSASLRPYL